jgi:S-adenosylmethionine:tRNA-ribosyltransferase-isomerase (queuine synthetase)
MDLQEFSYELPEALIAAFPSGKREDSRLLVVRRSTGELNHTLFSELGNFLDPGDLIVLNDTKVFPARLHGVKESGGKVEVLLLERFPDQRSLWMALVDAAKKPKVGRAALAVLCAASSRCRCVRLATLSNNLCLQFGGCRGADGGISLYCRAV